MASELVELLSANAARVIDLFREWDEDGDGRVSKKEFRRALPLLGLQVPREEVDALFDSWDPDGSGSLVMAELRERLLAHSAAVLARFRDLAENGDGQVYKDDFRHAVEALGFKVDLK